MKPSPPKRTQYPAGTLIAYGLDNPRATKLVATIVKSANPQEEYVLHRWLINEGEIRLSQRRPTSLRPKSGAMIPALAGAGRITRNAA